MRQPTSSKPRKQRKFRREAPLHLRKKFLNLHVPRQLRERLKIATRKVPAKKGMKVRVVKGKHKGKEGNITRISTKRTLIYIEGISHRTARGREKLVGIRPNNVVIIDENIKNYVKSESEKVAPAQ